MSNHGHAKRGAWTPTYKAWRYMRIAYLALDHSFPGVFEYEVCSPFGKWFGDHVIQHLDSPAKEQCEEQLDKLMLEFFSQGMKQKEAEKLHAILQGEAP